MQTVNGAAISLPFNNIFSTQPTDRKARHRKIQCNNKVLHICWVLPEEKEEVEEEEEEVKV